MHLRMRRAASFSYCIYGSQEKQFTNSTVCCVDRTVNGCSEENWTLCIAVIKMTVTKMQNKAITSAVVSLPSIISLSSFFSVLDSTTGRLTSDLNAKIRNRTYTRKLERFQLRCLHIGLIKGRYGLN